MNRRGLLPLYGGLYDRAADLTHRVALAKFNPSRTAQSSLPVGAHGVIASVGLYNFVLVGRMTADDVDWLWATPKLLGSEYPPHAMKVKISSIIGMFSTLATHNKFDPIVELIPRLFSAPFVGRVLLSEGRAHFSGPGTVTCFNIPLLPFVLLAMATISAAHRAGVPLAVASSPDHLAPKLGKVLADVISSPIIAMRTACGGVNLWTRSASHHTAPKGSIGLLLFSPGSTVSHDVSVADNVDDLRAPGRVVVESLAYLNLHHIYVVYRVPTFTHSLWEGDLLDALFFRMFVIMACGAHTRQLSSSVTDWAILDPIRPDENSPYVSKVLRDSVSKFLKINFASDELYNALGFEEGWGNLDFPRVWRENPSLFREVLKGFIQDM